MKLTRELLREIVPKNGLIYFVAGENGKIKIGSTCSLRERMKTIQAHSPERVKIIGLIDVTVVKKNAEELTTKERSIHKIFESTRSHFEWFNPSSELQKFIETDTRKPSLKDLEREGFGVPDHEFL